ncbi:hypothetical protein NE236_39750 [Actinoallomurus purpureus]|uniref:hypothetical protein n=1 Tax=Actinoallomurus purpureus TaxID=478114 RepID=UPI002092B351|nr:hypothetical protein [Actinoallomurus purpureus]MCO6011108.1 hypothetical protein [Actinoallomurus purpureus]
MSFETTALLVTWVALVLLALVVAGLVRQVHHLTRGPRTPDVGLATGMPAPGIDRLGPEPGRPTLLLFLGDECPACHDILEEAVGLADAPPIRALFLDGALDVDPPEYMRIFAGQGDLFERYQVAATPFAVLVGSDGRIRTAEPVGSVRALHALIAQADGRIVDAAGPTPGRAGVVPGPRTPEPGDASGPGAPARRDAELGGRTR